MKPIMSLADLPTLFVVPPLNCLLAACAGAALARRRAGRVLLAAGLTGLAALSVPAVSGTLRACLERGLPTQVDGGDPPRAIIVLSGDVREVLGGGLDGYDVGHLTLERERQGALLARGTGLPILVTGGIVQPGAPSLAALMDRSLRNDFATAPRWLEQRAQDTWQNAAYAAAMLHSDRVRTAYVVTHAWHMRRALIAFRAAGLRVVAAPVPPSPAPSLTPRNMVPRVAAWQESFYALHEWIGCFWYALHG